VVVAISATSPIPTWDGKQCTQDRCTDQDDRSLGHEVTAQHLVPLGGVGDGDFLTISVVVVGSLVQQAHVGPGDGEAVADPFEHGDVADLAAVQDFRDLRLVLAGQARDLALGQAELGQRLIDRADVTVRQS
jgi:hypothetical protein